MPFANMAKKSCNFDLKRAALAVFVVLLASCCGAQVATSPKDPFSQELSKYPGLLPELGKIVERLKNEVHFPPDRDHSNLFPLVPESTTYYMAFPNYGDAAHQALAIFQQELRESAVLRDWWQHTANGADAAKFEDAIERFYELSQYLGNEIVVSGDTTGTKNSFLIAEVQKPGLKDFLQQLLQELPENSRATVRVLDPQELPEAHDAIGQQGLMILVRTDFVVAAPNLEALRAANRSLNTKKQAFSTTAFGQRLAQSYQGGIGFLAAADLQKILQQLPGAPPQTEDMLNRAGFDNVKFFVWEHKSVAGQSLSQMELSFSGPRHGIASWLATPSILGSLEFVSPKAVTVAAINLKNLAEIFDGVRQLANLANPNAFASLDQMQQMMGVNLRNHLLSYLDGEITFEFDGLAGQQPLWRVILRVSDPERLQQTLSKLLAASGQAAVPMVEDGTKYYSVVIPSAKTPTEITYAFTDRYLVIASSQESVAEGIQAYRSGMSFGKSAKFLSSLATKPPEQASALLYYDPLSMSAAKMQSASPEMAQLFSHMQSAPVFVRAYADEDTIRVSGNNSGADAGAILVVAAIAIPNLLRAKIAANEATAIGTMRTIVTAQVSYETSYPQKGFARDLRALGTDPSGAKKTSPEHAGLMNWTVGGAACPTGSECTKAGYRFSMISKCRRNTCDDFTALATPLLNNSGVRSFCVTSDGIMRFSLAIPSTPTISSAECGRWAPLR